MFEMDYMDLPESNKKQNRTRWESSQKLSNSIMLDEIVSNKFLVAAIYASAGSWRGISELVNTIDVNGGHSNFTSLRQFIVKLERLNDYMDSNTILKVWNYAKELEIG